LAGGLVGGRLLSGALGRARGKRVEVNDACTACMGCIAVCPTSAIQAGPKGPRFIQESCIKCGYCATVCTVAAIRVLPGDIP